MHRLSLGELSALGWDRLNTVKIHMPAQRTSPKNPESFFLNSRKKTGEEGWKKRRKGGRIGERGEINRVEYTVPKPKGQNSTNMC